MTLELLTSIALVIISFSMGWVAKSWQVFEANLKKVGKRDDTRRS